MANSLHGIQEIEFVPGFDYREIVGRLQVALQSSQSLRAVVAYWCIGLKEFGPQLAQRLSGQGFLCVDIHLPTDIDRLCELKKAGANIYLYLLNPNPQPGELKSKVPPHLLHPKVLLFDYGSGTSDFWVGSHNWTARALTGINIEASMRLGMFAGCSLHSEAIIFLDAVRTHCEPFDINAVDYYKWLQQSDQEEQVWVLELRGLRSAIDADRKLTIFGKSEADYRNLKNVDKNVVVSLFDEGSGQEILYEAAIRDTGRDPTKGGVSLGARLYASQDGSNRPEVQGPKLPDPQLIASASSWATVEILDELYGSTFEVPPESRWETLAQDAEQFRMPPNLRNWFPNPQKPLVQEAIPRPLFERSMRAASEGVLMLMDAGMKLLRKKVVRAKRRDGQTFTLRTKRPRDEKPDE